MQCHCEKCRACVLFYVWTGEFLCQKKKQKTSVRKETCSLLRSFNQLFLRFANNYSFIHLYKRFPFCPWNNLFIDGSLPVTTSTTTTKERVFYSWRVAFMTCFYVRQYIILFCYVFVYFKKWISWCVKKTTTNAFMWKIRCILLLNKMICYKRKPYYLKKDLHRPFSL